MESSLRPLGGSRHSLPAWGLYAGLALIALVYGAVMVRYEPPAPRDAETPAEEFSAARARAVLAEALGAAQGHPVGTVANEEVRSRLAAALERAGYAPEVQEAVGCHPSGSCARVRNLVARLPGSDPGGIVLVATHYDSVAAGPGAADDLAAAAAVVEAARALKTGPQPRNTFVFLIDDGEEAGLLGAHAFAERHPLAGEVDAVLNFESRGTAGASLMFETDRDNAWLLGLWAAAAPRPITSSLFSTIYERMPNDTDFTVWKGAGMRGLNFAFIGNPAHYHTPLDNLDNLSLGSLQHHGDNLLAAARALAGADLSGPPRGAAVFFDVFGFGVVRWPAGWTLGLAALALALVAAAAVRLVRRGETHGGGVAWGLLALPAAVLLAGLAGWVLGEGVLGRGAYGAIWLPEPPAAAPFWLLALAGAVLAGALLARRAGAWGAWAAVWSLWALVGVLAGLAVPGASFLFIVPALLAGLLGLAAPRLPSCAALVPLAAAGALWFPLLRFLPDALGAGILPVVSAVVALALSGLVPLAAAASRRSRWLAMGALAGAALVLAGWAITRPAFTPLSPQALNVGFHQEADAAGRPVQSRLFVAGPVLRLPPELQDAAAWESAPQPLHPWSGVARLRVAPALPLPLPPPELTTVGDLAGGGGAGGAGERRIVLRLVSPRGAPTAGLALSEEAQVRRLTVAGTPVPAQEGRMGPWVAQGWSVVTFTGMPAEGIEVTVQLGAEGPIEAWVFDRSYGLPPEAEAVARRRPATVVPVNTGDVTVLSRKAVVGGASP